MLIPAATSPSEGESTLARMLGEAFRVEFVQPNAWAEITPELLEIAKQGLTGDERDASAARSRLDALNLAMFASPFATPEPKASPPGAYIVIRNTDGEIYIRPNRDGPTPTDDQLAFAGELARQDRLVRQVYMGAIGDSDQRNQATDMAIGRLLMAGQIGLQDGQPNVRLARLASDGVLLDALAEHGVTIRGKYLRSLGQAYLLWSLLLVVAALTYGYVLYGAWAPPATPSEVVLPKLQLILVIVSMASMAVGAWLAAVVLVEPDGPEVVGSIFAATLGSNLRVVYTLGFGFIALLLFHKKAVIFALGAQSAATGFSTEFVLTQLSSAIITGTLLGVGARAIPNAIVAKSASLVGSLSK